MIWRPSRLRKAAKWALGAVLFAQFALAAQACVMPTFRPAAAFSAADAMPFCEQMQVICLAQCLQADQAVDSPHDLVAAPPATSSASWVQLAAFASPAPSPGAATLSTGPPVYLSSHRLRL